MGTASVCGLVDGRRREVLRDLWYTGNGCVRARNRLDSFPRIGCFFCSVSPFAHTHSTFRSLIVALFVSKMSNGKEIFHPLGGCLRTQRHASLVRECVNEARWNESVGHLATSSSVSCPPHPSPSRTTTTALKQWGGNIFGTKAKRNPLRPTEHCLG